MEIIRKKCWKCKGDGKEIVTIPGRGMFGLNLTYEEKHCSVCVWRNECKVESSII